MCHENVAAAKFTVLADLQLLSLSADGVCSGFRQGKRPGGQQRQFAVGVDCWSSSSLSVYTRIFAAAMSDKEKQVFPANARLVESPSSGFEDDDPESMSEHACEISLQCPSAFLWKDLVPGLMPRRLIQFHL